MPENSDGSVGDGREALLVVEAEPLESSLLELFEQAADCGGVGIMLV